MAMSDLDVETLTRRLDRLERGLRRWRIVGGIAWAALAASVAFFYVIAFHTPADTETEAEGTPSADNVEEEVRARAFVLVDEDGAPRAALAMRPDGTPALAFTGQDGRITWKAP
jgi:hypothetical protein